MEGRAAAPSQIAAEKIAGQAKFDNSREFDLVPQWIELNRGVLINYWDGAFEYTEDALDALKPIGKP